MVGSVCLLWLFCFGVYGVWWDDGCVCVVVCEFEILWYFDYVDFWWWVGLDVGCLVWVWFVDVGYCEVFWWCCVDDWWWYEFCGVC